MRARLWKRCCAVVLVAATVAAACNAAAADAGKPAPLVIQEQGSFAVGGTASTAPGKFDPAAAKRPARPIGATTPTLLPGPGERAEIPDGDAARAANFPGPGKPRRMGGKDFRISSCAGNSPPT